jgi:hypothetical protein
VREHHLDRDGQETGLLRARQLPEPAVAGSGRRDERTVVAEQEDTGAIGLDARIDRSDQERSAQALTDVRCQARDQTRFAFGETAGSVFAVDAEEAPALAAGAEHRAQLVAEAGAP